MSFKVGIGQDSHRFVDEGDSKTLVLGGVEFPDTPGLSGNSDADVVLHAVCNAISGISCQPVLGPVTDKLCREEGITDSAVYVREALKTLKTHRLTHISVTLECKRPKILPRMQAMRTRMAEILDLGLQDIAITATTGEGLTSFGRGEGIQAFVMATAVEK